MAKRRYCTLCDAKLYRSQSCCEFDWGPTVCADCLAEALELDTDRRGIEEALATLEEDLADDIHDTWHQDPT